jgi:integral membrane protein (TIGR01906 family)
LNIEKYTDLSKDQIKATYDYLIYYINSTEPIKFKIPLLISSKEGIIHFEEVKTLFTKLNYILFIATLFIAFGVYFMKKYRDFSPLKWCSNLLFCGCLIILASFFINFGRAFDKFHEMFFNNDYWLFSPKTDPVINILPEEYFLHCSILILLLVFCWGIVLRIVYRYLHKKVHT